MDVLLRGKILIFPEPEDPKEIAVVDQQGPRVVKSLALEYLPGGKRSLSFVFPGVWRPEEIPVVDLKGGYASLDL
jgi:hypothetical protein